MKNTAYDYRNPSLSPQYGVTASLSPDFKVASGSVFAWFADLQTAKMFAIQAMCPVWDLNTGVLVLA